MPDRRRPTSDDDDLLFRNHMQGEDPPHQAPDPTPTEQAKSRWQDDALPGSFREDRGSTGLPSILTVKKNAFRLDQTSFQVGTSTYILAQLPDPLKRRTEEALRTIEGTERISLPSENAMWQELAEFLYRRGVYDNAAAQARALGPNHANKKTFFCVDCRKPLPPSFEWCKDPNCPSAVLYRRATGSLPTLHLSVVEGGRTAEDPLPSDAHGRPAKKGRRHNR